MNYVATDTIPYFKDCASIVDAAGFVLIELQAVPQRGNMSVTAVIASKDPSKDIGVSDCAAVHHALREPLVSLLARERGGTFGEDNVYMEVCSPGVGRTMKNAAEFAFFTGRPVRVWDKGAGDWVAGTVLSSDAAGVTLGTEGGERTFAYEDIAKAKLAQADAAGS